MWQWQGRQIEAVLFDKDGTLLDFHATWDAAVGEALLAATKDDGARTAAARALGYDLERMVVNDGSPFVAESNDVILELLAPHLDPAVFGEACVAASIGSVVAAPGAQALLDRVTEAGVRCAIVTNDWVEIARAQLDVLGWKRYFPVVVGSDSGYDAKPEPGPVVGALDELGIEPGAALMVGDSRHDLEAARAAGVMSVLVTNHVTPSTELADAADLVIATLAELGFSPGA